MKMAMPSAIGVEMISARTDEYSVPQMNGRAPNCPATGSQVSVCQNCQPNSWIESRDWRNSSTPMRDDQADQQHGERARPGAEHDLVGTGARSAGSTSYLSLIFSSAFSSMSTTAFGSGA